MTAQEYIKLKLDELKKPLDIQKPRDNEALAEAIYKLVMSKKFRKYSASDELKEHIKNAISLNIDKQQPINFTFLHGAYKLWRLEESPEADWAELFALMYYSAWVKPICEIYGPGVWFDFFVDDLIVPKLNNVDIKDIRTYIKSYQLLIDFLKDYQPSNLKMTITPVGSKFESEEAFDESLQRNLEKITAELPAGLPMLTTSQRAIVELNTKVTEEQLKDPKWAEKVYHLHNAYMLTKAEPGYYKGKPEKIAVFTQPLPSGATISVGTTKDTIMKFWVAVGVLKPKGDSFRQIILSPNQLKEVKFEFVNLDIGLTGKNFKKIRVLE